MKMPQTVVKKLGTRWYTDWKVLALAVGGAAAAGILLGTRGGGTSAAAAPIIPTVTIRPGGPTFGGPR
jgi:hypothetical protein